MVMFSVVLCCGQEVLVCRSIISGSIVEWSRRHSLTSHELHNGCNTESITYDNWQSDTA